MSEHIESRTIVADRREPGKYSELIDHAWTLALVAGSCAAVGWKQTLGMWCVLAAFRLQNNFESRRFIGRT